MTHKGLFVSLEGPDGSGKSTLAQGLAEKLAVSQIPHLTTREPGGTEIAERIRDIILDVDNQEMSARCEALLYAASRAQHTDEKIRPALEEGYLVLSDRYVISSLAYQGAGRQLGLDAVAQINHFATGGLAPDLVLFLDVEPLKVLDRKAEGAGFDRLELEADEFHSRVYQGYYQALEGMSGVHRIDASQSISQVLEEAWSAILIAWEESR